MTILLSRRQFFLFIFIAQTGSVFISFQRPLIDEAGRNAWLVFIGASLLHYLILILYEKNYKFFEIKSSVAYLYVLYWLFLSIVAISYVDYTLAEWAFPKTPQYIVLFLMVLVSFYCNIVKEEVAVNFGVFLLPMIVLFFAFLLMALREAEWTYLFPLGDATVKEWGKGLFYAQYPFLGVEIYLFFRHYVNQQAVIKGMPLFLFQLFWTFFFTFTIIISLLFFPLAEISTIKEPIMYILKSQHVTFIERLDLFFIYIWMTWSIITITIFSFSAMHVYRKNNNKNRFKVVALYHLLLLFVPLFLLTKDKVEFLQKLAIYVHPFFAYVIPLLIILINRRRA